MRKYNRFRIKKTRLLYCFRSLWFFLKYVQAVLPETSLFLFAQMAVLSRSFQMFKVLGMYNFVQTCLSILDNEKTGLPE